MERLEAARPLAFLREQAYPLAEASRLVRRILSQTPGKGLTFRVTNPQVQCVDRLWKGLGVPQMMETLGLKLRGSSYTLEGSRNESLLRAVLNALGRLRRQGDAVAVQAEVQMLGNISADSQEVLRRLLEALCVEESVPQELVQQTEQVAHAAWGQHPWFLVRLGFLPDSRGLYKMESDVTPLADVRDRARLYLQAIGQHSAVSEEAGQMEVQEDPDLAEALRRSLEDTVAEGQKRSSSPGQASNADKRPCRAPSAMLPSQSVVQDQWQADRVEEPTLVAEAIQLSLDEGPHEAQDEQHPARTEGVMPSAATILQFGHADEHELVAEAIRLSLQDQASEPPASVHSRPDELDATERRAGRMDTAAARQRGDADEHELVAEAIRLSLQEEEQASAARAAATSWQSEDDLLEEALRVSLVSLEEERRRAQEEEDADLARALQRAWED